MLGILIDACHKVDTITCANNAAYIIKGIGQVHITVVNEYVVILNNVLYVPNVKKNLPLVSAIAMHGYLVNFPRFRDLSILDRPMVEIFRKQKSQYI